MFCPFVLFFSYFQNSRENFTIIKNPQMLLLISCKFWRLASCVCFSYALSLSLPRTIRIIEKYTMLLWLHLFSCLVLIFLTLLFIPFWNYEFFFEQESLQREIIVILHLMHHWRRKRIYYPSSIFSWRIYPSRWTQSMWGR